MKNALKIFSLVLVGSSLLAAQSTSQPSGRAGSSTPAPNTTVNAAPQSQLIRILTPVAGKATTENAVLVRYQLTNPAASAGSPNFKLQLDGQDPITTMGTEYTFTGLAPGTHSINVVLVDANGTPVMGGSAAVQFTVKNPTPTPRGSATIGEPLPPADAPERASFTPGELGGNSKAQPSGNSLPILSLIGFGVLIGGVASAFKTRE